MTLTSKPASVQGLSSEEAQQRLRQYGPNAIPEQRRNPIRALLSKFWGPVPWMLEASIVLQLTLGRAVDAVISLVLIIVNAALSFVQENRAQNALALLRQNLTIQTRVKRDGAWQSAPASDLVPGDVIRIRVGDIMPADARLLDGQIASDQSSLTGESLPVDVSAGGTAYAGSVITRGEATAEVTDTGQQSFYGKTAQLVQSARTASHLEAIVQGVVKYLVVMNGILAAAVLVFAVSTGKSLADFLPFTLMLLVASIPIALPATFTLTSALGSQELAKRGVLVTRLSAIEEAAGMNVLCSDKTGTLTQNTLALAAMLAYSPFSESDLLRYAALASNDATQDPIDLAVLAGAHQHGVALDNCARLRFVPFDPSTKRTEADVTESGKLIRVVKGYPQTIADLAQKDVASDVEALALHGYRVIAVAVESDNLMHMVGLIGLQDPPRAESPHVIKQLRELGVRVLMITGDSLATAKAIAAQVGLGTRDCQAEALRKSDFDASALECDVFAGVFPEDKFNLVRALQRAGHITGMTGDGVNDSPALKQAEVGVAVANATDVAKAAASLVLTNPGLSDMLAAVEIGRRIYQRMLTYTLNKIIKTFQVGLFLSLSLFLLGELVTRPRLILLLLFANDFVTMALATDNVRASTQPNRWNLRPLVMSALVLAAGWLMFSFAVLAFASLVLRLELSQTQTLVFVMLVFTGQANVYLVRERSHFWTSRPSKWLIISSSADVLIVGTMAAFGVLMTPISPMLIVVLALATLAYMTALDILKIAAFRKFKLGSGGAFT